MRRLMLVVGMAVAGAVNAADDSSIAVECRSQAALVDQTYSMFRSGMSEQDAVRNQTHPQATADTKRWLSRMVHVIYSDSRSMFVNQGATVFAYEHQCLADPETYLRSKDLLK